MSHRPLKPSGSRRQRGIPSPPGAARYWQASPLISRHRRSVLSMGTIPQPISSQVMTAFGILLKNHIQIPVHDLFDPDLDIFRFFRLLSDHFCFSGRCSFSRIPHSFSSLIDFSADTVAEHSVTLSLRVILTQYCVYQSSNIDMKIQNSLRNQTRLPMVTVRRLPQE